MVLALGFVGSRYSSHLVLRTLLFRGISVQGLGVAVYIVAMPRALNDRRERGNGLQSVSAIVQSLVVQAALADGAAKGRRRV